MTFEFLIAYRREPQTDIEQILIELLSKVLEDNLNDFGPDTVADMISVRHERDGDESVDENGTTFRSALVGFRLELPDDTEQIQAVVKEFSRALSETPPVSHAVK